MSARRRILVTGGAGFLGSHVIDALLERGDEVVCVDNLSTGTLKNVEHHGDNPRFTFINADITAHPDLTEPVEGILHLACPASPRDYMRMPLMTLAIGSRGSEWVLDVARRNSCRVIISSTSEVYGDPTVHPQPETYWGNVNPVGPRSVYDESKRFAEALFAAHRSVYGTNTGIVRIFNTYGPRLAPVDGRVVSNFISQVLAGRPITVYGDGSQTRSFCYVSDMVRGLLAMLDSEHPGPINLGNPIELNMLELARAVMQVAEVRAEVMHEPLPVDDPARRKPDITLAWQVLGWRPEVPLIPGLRETYEWQKSLHGETERLVDPEDKKMGVLG